MRPASWVSDDGRTWRRSGAWTGRIDLDADERNGSQFVRAWAVPTGGFDAMQAFWSGDREEDPLYERPTLWHSDDGLAWTRLGVLPTDTWIDPYALPWGAADATGRRVIVSGEQGCAMWSSSDGREFRAADHLWRCEGNPWAIVAPAGSEPWILAATGGGQPVAIGTQDFENWAMATMPTVEGTAEVFAPALARAGESLVAVAAAVNRTGTVPPVVARPQMLTWISEDAASWELADVSTDPGPGALIEYLADGPAGLLGFGRVFEPYEDGDGYDITLWQLDRAD